MNPHQKNKVDVSSLTPEEQRLFRLYGKLPSKSDHFAKHLRERKYFDSGDYAMSKAGKGDSVDTGAVGSQHPVPENIPHLSSPTQNAGGLNGGPGHQHHPSVSGAPAAAANVTAAAAAAGSPVKEGSFLHRETSADAPAAAAAGEANPNADEAKGIPIRR
ncbi:camp-regulated phosphoprotein/endosulfine conserved region-domain-containing protein [Xylariomycetidae sp. FL0641]|nr:camp-regulated phosphoprotein/endosulfine conserved region-domain-containing protein [Xylariomycetidae sp. FL0641]